MPLAHEFFNFVMGTYEFSRAYYRIFSRARHKFQCHFHGRSAIIFITDYFIFWHNHFVTADIGDRRVVYDYMNTLRTHALGDFRQFVKDITIDHAMLRYLNGNQNNKNAPNENYARELLELFTIGKGPLVAEGDYSNYTEDDIIAICRDPASAQAFTTLFISIASKF